MGIMKFKDTKEKNMVYRGSLKPNWKKFDFDATDRVKKLPKPDVCKKYESGEVYELDKELQDFSEKTLYDVVHSRRSVRQYEDGLMTKRELSYLVNLTCDIVKYGPGYAIGVVPSGGATSTLETYLYMNKVEGFKKGLYHYMKDQGDLRLIREDINDDMVNDAISNQLRGAQVIFFWTCTPYRGEYKYSYLSHKMIAMEAGHACQNLYLASEAIDYGTVAIAAYDQCLADQLLQVGESEYVIYVGAVGKKM